MVRKTVRRKTGCRKTVGRKPKVQRRRRTMRGGQTPSGQIPLRQESSFNRAAAQGNAIKESLTEYNEFDKKLGAVVVDFQEQWESSKKTGTKEELQELLNKYKSNLMSVLLGQTTEEYIAAILAANKPIAVKLQKELCAKTIAVNART